MYRPKGRMHFHSFTYTSALLSSSAGVTNYAKWTSRYAFSVSSNRPCINTFSTYVEKQTGHHYVSPISTHARLDGPRDRDAPQSSLRPQLDMGQRAEPFHGQMIIGSRLLSHIDILFRLASRTFVHIRPFIYSSLPSLALCIIKGKVVPSGV